MIANSFQSYRLHIALAIASAVGLAASGLVSPSRGTSLAPAPVSAATNVSEMTLDNGLRVVVVPDNRVPVVTHMVWYAVGSVEERDDEHGVAHYLEHMMFKGTERYPKGAFDQFVARKGGQQNARTWSTGTMYWQRMPKSALGQLMDMEADRMTNLRIEDKDVASERAVVMEELRRQQIGVSFDLGNRVRAALYDGHPEGRAVIGTADSIASLDGAKAQSFYERFYGPSRATVVIAGDVTMEEVEDLVGRTYAKVPSTRELAPRVVGKMPKAGIKERVEAAHERATTVSVSRSYLTPGASGMSWRDQYLASLFSVIAGNGMTSRLFQRLVMEKGLANNVSCTYRLAGSASFGVLDCYASGKNGVVAADLESAFDGALMELAQGGITDAEFDEAKSRFIASDPMRKDNVFERADGLGGRLMEGVPLLAADSQNTLILDATRADVERVARMILTTSRNVTGILVPKAEAPPEAVPATK